MRSWRSTNIYGHDKNRYSDSNYVASNIDQPLNTE